MRLERVDTPMADPDTMVHMIDWTLDEVFAALRSRKAFQAGGAPRTASALRAICHCGLNPFLNYFLAGEQALLEALVLVQASEPSLDSAHRDTAITELYLVMHAIARVEVESLCSICQHRPRSEDEIDLASRRAPRPAGVTAPPGDAGAPCSLTETHRRSGETRG